MCGITGAIIGSAVVGAGSSIIGANKQASASKKAAKMQMDQFNIQNQQQMPFMQSGYGALNKLNMLMGLGPRSGSGGAPAAGGYPAAGLTVNNGYGGAGINLPPQMQLGKRTGTPTMNPGGGYQVDDGGPNQWPQLRQIMSLRAAHGDKEAQRALGMV